jgi:hypothetical protein
MYKCISALQPYYNFTLLLYPVYHLFLHLLSTNHKYTQPCYFPLLLKPAAQKLKMTWSSTIWSSRRAIATGRLPVRLWCLSTATLLRVFVTPRVTENLN